jgi:hypothetical protein
MKKLKPLESRTVSSEEFEETLKNTIFKKLTPEEQERIDSQLPKSLRKGDKKQKPNS